MWNKMDLAISSLFLSFLSHFLWIMDPPRSSFNQLFQAPLDQSWQSWALIKGKWWPHLWVTPIKPPINPIGKGRAKVRFQNRSGKSGYKIGWSLSTGYIKVPQYFNRVSQWLNKPYTPIYKSIPYFKQFLELVFCFKISKFEAGKADTKEVDLPLHSLLGYPNG